MKIIHLNFVPDNFLGVKRKLLGQIQAMLKNGHTVIQGEFTPLGYFLQENRFILLKLVIGFFVKLVKC